MSMYEGLSLVLSTVGTMLTVYLGFRQLRQTAPAAQAVPAGPMAYPAVPTAGPVHGYRPGPPAHGAAPVPAPHMGYGRAAVRPQAGGWAAPYGPPQPYGAPYLPPARTVSRARPQAVTAASILLFVAAALQPIAMISYYGIEYAINAEAAATDLSNAGLFDGIGLGIIAILCGILGIFVARGKRTAAWLVWIFALLGVPFAGLAVLGLTFTLVEPTAETGHPALVGIVMAYLMVVAVAIAASASLLLGSKARDYYFKKA